MHFNKVAEWKHAEELERASTELLTPSQKVEDVTEKLRSDASLKEARAAASASIRAQSA
jgi:hypothetical protein